MEQQKQVAAAPADTAEHVPATGLPAVEVIDLRAGYGRKHPTEVVHGVSFCVNQGEFVCIVGANGCGKTTTLKAMMGLLPPLAGRVLAEGRDVYRMGGPERAQRFAYIPQAHTPPFPFSVADVVMMGRTPYLTSLSKPTQADRRIALAALRLLGIEELAREPYTSLSGGQRQLVLIARALAQEATVLVMDEPTAALDFGNQHLVLSRMKTLSQMGKAVVMVTHDPDHALFCADKVIVMERGRILEVGTPGACITTGMIREIYGAEARVMDVEVEAGRVERVCIPLM